MFIKLLLIFQFLSGIICVNLVIKEAQVGQRYFVEADTLLTLTCVSDSISQRENVEWFLPNDHDTPVTITDNTKAVSVKSEIEGSKRNVILSVRDVSNQFHGTYLCRSYQYDGSKKLLLAHAQLMVNLFRPISIKNCRNEQWIQINKKGTLRCMLYSEPTAAVTWSFNGRQLKQSQKYKISSWGIEISNAGLEDSGHYVVQARQIDYKGSFIQDIIVKVFELPRITAGPRLVGPLTDGILENWYADVQCLATGNPPPTVHWFLSKDLTKELQYANPQKFFVNTNPTVGKMRIYRPTYPDDNGEYTCIAMIKNPAIDNDNFPKEVISRSINLSVSVYPEYQDFDQMTNLIEAGKTALIRCRVRVTDPVQMYWQKVNGPVFQVGPQPDDPRIKVTFVSEPLNLVKLLTLQIDNVRYEDSWNYSCITTGPGFNVSLNGTIMVRQAPLMDLGTPVEVSGWLYNATNLTCIARGFPRPAWRWSRNMYNIENTPNITFRIISYDYETYSQTWLQIYPDDSTRYWVYNTFYKCEAVNEEGSATRIVRYTPAQIPSSPGLKLGPVTASSIELRVYAPKKSGGMHLQHYELEYRALQGRTAAYGPVFYQPAPNPLVIRVAGLMHDTNYHMELYACNAVGRSEPQTVSVATPSATAPSSLQFISELLSNYPYAYTLRWEVPLNGGSPLVGYRFRLQRLSLMNNYRGNRSLLYLVQHPEWFHKSKYPARRLNPVLNNPYLNKFRLDDLEAMSLYKIEAVSTNLIGVSNTTTFFFLTPQADSLGKPARIRGGQSGLFPSYLLFLLAPSSIILTFLLTDP